MGAALVLDDGLCREAPGNGLSVLLLVGRTHSGIDAIKAWKAAASTKYTYTTEPFALQQSDGHQVVTSRVEGNFPGSPVDLRYRFRLERGLIASLEITV